MKTQTKTIGEYNAPKCKVVEVHVQNLVCASPYGDQGRAGNGYNESNTADYGDDF